jgi:aspartyl-tRNA(Asn)/glutamyl-tRNA(Gln) amidotransferase subunit A
MGVNPSVADLGAGELRQRLASGALRATELAQAFLSRIRERDGAIQAFAWCDPDFVMKQAGAIDGLRGKGRPLGALHGLPVALTDTIDTLRIPTENGTAADKERVPFRDAAIVERLKAEGAIILGKTVTSELGLSGRSTARNPANPDHAAGGASAGAAAAVAAGMAPLAISAQSRASTATEASFCGIAGYRPTFGSISRRGVLANATSLDIPGIFARNPQDAALLAETLFGHDPKDTVTQLAPHPRLLETCLSATPVKPVFGFVRTPFWDQADAQIQDAFSELADLLGDNCFEAELPSAFSDAGTILDTIALAETAKSLAGYHARKVESLGAHVKETIEAGNAIRARDYLAALDWPTVYNAGLGEIFERCDAILTPATPGPAPAGDMAGGDTMFGGLWALCGLPSVTLPLFEAGNGLPMGVQLVGPKVSDGRLLRTARWLGEMVAGTD